MDEGRRVKVTILIEDDQTGDELVRIEVPHVDEDKLRWAREMYDYKDDYPSLSPRRFALYNLRTDETSCLHFRMLHPHPLDTYLYTITFAKPLEKNRKIFGQHLGVD